MKIGIITQPLHTNYGGLLQNYALQQILKRLGHEPITLDQSVLIPPLWRIIASYVKTFLLKLIGKGANRQYPFLLSKKQQLYIRQHTSLFIEKYIVHTKPFLSVKDFRYFTVKHQLEALVVGSDQVWRPIYNSNVFCSFFDFAKGLNIKRLAYAASFGVDHWEFTEQQTKNIQELICDFDAVSVREYSGVNLCLKYLGCNAVHVLDPTMLLNKEDYIRLIKNEKESPSKGHLFIYILDESNEKHHIIDKVASELNLKPFSIMPTNRLDAYPPVTQWIRSFMDAEFIVCDSFHGVVFSIIFNKPFLVFGNKERGMSRFNSLLELFGIENRMIDEDSSVLSILKVSIDWEKINAKRELLKKKSIDFINNCLRS